MNTFHHTGGDDDEETQEDPVIHSNELGDDIGKKIGEGHDPVEDGSV